MRNDIAVRRPANGNARAVPPKVNGQFLNAYARNEGRIQLRQIDEFSSSYQKKKQKGIFLAMALIGYSAICLFLFTLNIDTAAFFSAGALILIFQLVQCGHELTQEGVRTQRAYYVYLGGFSNHVLSHLRRTAKLSAWSRYEIDQYLESIS